MRHKLEIILGEELRFLTIATRDRLKLTQKEMGEKLQMSECSYSYIETGKTKCGTLTTVLLLNMQDDLDAFIKSVARKFAEWYEKEMLTL